jgi:hypothetical protein
MLRLGLLAVALATLAACGGGSSGGDGVASGTTTGSPPAAEAGLEGQTLDGGRLSLADLRGTPVFVNVWASW